VRSLEPRLSGASYSMSLLVLDPDIAMAEGLCQQLTDLGFHTVATTQSRVAEELCSQGGAEVLIVCGAQPQDSVPEVPAGVGLVFASHEPLDLSTTLHCMRQGMHDCWQLPESDEVLKSLVDALLNREQMLLNQVGAELRDMRHELEADQRAGQYIQMGMLPESPAQLGELELAHRIAPSLFLSGDFIDYFELDEHRTVFYVADVSGHGASSAFVTVLLKNFSNRLQVDLSEQANVDPASILTWINGELISQHMNKHVAMFLGCIDQRAGTLSYANAAQFPPALLLTGSKLVSLEQKGKPLGLFPKASYAAQRVDFPAGARLLVFSDGVLDLIVGDTLADKEEKLRQIVLDHDSIEEVWEALNPQAYGHDDVSCLELLRKVS